jgi:hypothetical protein
VRTFGGKKHIGSGTSRMKPWSKEAWRVSDLLSAATIGFGVCADALAQASIAMRRVALRSGI